MTEAEYRELIRPHARAVRQLRTDLDFFIEDVGPINLFSISSRLKDFGSAAKKSRRLGISADQLQDLAGIRIVVATQHDIDVVARFFYREQESKDLEVESDKDLSREDGYRARHLVAVMQPRYTRSGRPARIEIQLLTVLQHAFNFMSRAWVYKSDTFLSPEWQSRFTELAKNLCKQDELANALHSEVIQSASTLADAGKLTPMSYQRLVHKVFAENITLDDAVDSCRMMVDLGYRTNGAVRSFFEDDRIEDLRGKFRTSTSAFARSLREIGEDWPKNMFWMTFGTRYEAILRLLAEEVNSETAEDT